MPPPLGDQGLAREGPSLVARCHSHSVGELVWGCTWELQVPARPNKELMSLLWGNAVICHQLGEGISENQESQ